MAEEIKNEAAEAQASAAAPAAADNKRKKSGRYVPSGIAYVQASFNNTKVTFTDLHGNVLCWSTGGKNGFIHICGTDRCHMAIDSNQFRVQETCGVEIDLHSCGEQPIDKRAGSPMYQSAIRTCRDHETHIDTLQCCHLQRFE